MSPTTDRVGVPFCPLGLSGSRLTRPNNETSRKTILVGEGTRRRGRAPMGFFARRLTTISIVYDFNNLGAALLARLDTFSVVNRATKSVFMGKRRRSGLSPSCLSPSSSAARSYAHRGIERRGTTDWRTDRKGPRRLEVDPLVPSTTDRFGLVARKNVSGVYIFARVYTCEGALRGAIYIH